MLRYFRPADQNPYLAGGTVQPAAGSTMPLRTDVIDPVVRAAFSTRAGTGAAELAFPGPEVGRVSRWLNGFGGVW